MTGIKRGGSIRWVVTGITSLFLAALFLAPALTLADDVIQGFSAQGPLPIGTLVAVTDKSPTTVEAAPADDPSRIFGVVIDPSEAPLTLNRVGQQVFVANAGAYSVLVSTENGKINIGDYISVSSTSGIAAKATSNQDFVLGRAADFFDGSSNVVQQQKGHPVGKITVSINPGRNPTLKSQLALPDPLKRVGDAIAGRSVSAARVWTAFAVFLIAAFVGVIVLVVGVRAGLISIGRNPLSRHTILLGLFQVITIALAVFIIGLIGVYLLLKL